MSILYTVAAWLAHLSPVALFTVTFLICCTAFFAGVFIIWFALSVLSGAGETNDGEREEGDE